MRFWTTFSGTRSGALWAAVIVSQLACGCGDRLASLKGTVSIDGRVAPKGVAFEFSPVGPGTSSYAATGADGQYEAEFTFRKKGIQPGRYIVRLMPSVIEAAMPTFDDDGKPIGVNNTPSPLTDLPKKYYERIEEITISPGRNSYDITLLSSEK